MSRDELWTASDFKACRTRLATIAQSGMKNTADSPNRALLRLEYLQDENARLRARIRAFEATVEERA